MSVNTKVRELVQELVKDSMSPEDVAIVSDIAVQCVNEADDAMSRVLSTTIFRLRPMTAVLALQLIKANAENALETLREHAAKNMGDEIAR